MTRPLYTLQQLSKGMVWSEYIDKLSQHLKENLFHVICFIFLISVE